MSDTVQIALIASVAPTLVAILNYLQQRKVHKDVRKIEVATNSMKDALVNSTAKASHAEGRAEGIESERDRDAVKRIEECTTPGCPNKP